MDGSRVDAAATALEALGRRFGPVASEQLQELRRLAAAIARENGAADALYEALEVGQLSRCSRPPTEKAAANVDDVSRLHTLGRNALFPPTILSFILHHGTASVCLRSQ